jgi:hypothetical protein
MTAAFTRPVMAVQRAREDASDKAPLEFKTNSWIDTNKYIFQGIERSITSAQKKIDKLNLNAISKCDAKC